MIINNIKILLKKIIHPYVINFFLNIVRFPISFKKYINEYIVEVTWSNRNFVKNKYLKFLNLELKEFVVNIDYLINLSNLKLSINNLTYKYSNPQFWDSKYIKTSKLLSKKINIINGSLKNVQIIGNSNLIILDNDRVYYETKYFDNENKYKYSDGGIVKYDSSLCLIKSKKKNDIIEKGIKFSSNYSWNYYHLLYEVFSQFYYLKNSKLNINIPIIIDKIIWDVPQYQELFSLLNGDERKFIIIEKGKRYLVKELYYFARGAIIPPNYNLFTRSKPEDNLFDVNTLEFLRSNLLKNKLSINTPKRIFISRKNASLRRKYNEEEIINILSSYNFEVVYPEKYTIVEQITLFNNAEYIIGTTGAAFTNILFCSPNCKVLCLTNYNLPFSYFSTIAIYVGIEMFYLYDKNLKLNNYSYIHDEFEINEKEISEFLKYQWHLLTN